MGDFNGSNKTLSARLLFGQRAVYRIEAYKDLNANLHSNVVDFNFAEFCNYGRIDYNLNSIAPLTRFLKKIPNKSDPDQTSVVFNFVSDAFANLVSHFENSIVNGNLIEGVDFLSDITAHRGYEDPERSYYNYTNELMDVYINTFLQNKNNDIKNIKDFADNLLPFIKKMTSLFPITYSGWQRSAKSSIFTTGLAIGIADLPFDDDSLKEKYFLDNKYLNFYVDSCNYHGFMVSRNSPFLLVANINSPRMKQHMENNSMTSNPRKFFDSNVHQLSYEKDLEFLKDVIVQGYIKFYNKNIMIKEFKFSKKNNHMVTIIKARQNININYIDNILNFNYIINLYNNIRNIEENNVFQQSDINRFTKNAIKQTKYFDNDSIVSYINRQYQSTFKSKQGGFHYYNERFIKKHQKE
jgi:hypothetical protein